MIRAVIIYDISDDKRSYYLPLRKNNPSGSAAAVSGDCWLSRMLETETTRFTHFSSNVRFTTGRSDTDIPQVRLVPYLYKSG